MFDGDKSVAQSFRVDDEGRVVFQGRIVPDRATAETIQGRLKVLYYVAMAGGVGLAAAYTIVIDLPQMLELGVALCIALGLAMWLWVQPLVRHLPKAGKQFRRGESIGNRDRSRLRRLLLTSVVFVAIGVFALMAGPPEDRWPTLGATAFFGFAGLVFAWRMAAPEKREPPTEGSSRIRLRDSTPVSQQRQSAGFGRRKTPPPGGSQQ